MNCKKISQNITNYLFLIDCKEKGLSDGIATKADIQYPSGLASELLIGVFGLEIFCIM